MSDTNYSRFLEFLTRLSKGEIAEVPIIDSRHPYQFRWQDGYIEWRQVAIPSCGDWIRDSADVEHHMQIASDYAITWLGETPSPQPERSNVRRVEL